MRRTLVLGNLGSIGDMPFSVSHP